jgi:hypothetical protein
MAFGKTMVIRGDDVHLDKWWNHRCVDNLVEMIHSYTVEGESLTMVTDHITDVN